MFREDIDPGQSISSGSQVDLAGLKPVFSSVRWMSK